MIWLPNTYHDISFLRQWVIERIDSDDMFSDGYPIGILDNKTREIKCAFILSAHTGNNIIMSGAIDGPLVGPTEVALALHQVFCEPLSVLRITALINEMNKPSISLMERLGFIKEGTLRDYEEEGVNTLLYGLTKSDFYGGKYGSRIRKVNTGAAAASPIDGTATVSDGGDDGRSESVSC